MKPCAIFLILWLLGIIPTAIAFIMVYYRDERAKRENCKRWWFFNGTYQFDPHGEMVPASVVATIFWPLFLSGVLCVLLWKKICVWIKQLTNNIIDGNIKFNVKIK